MVTGDKFYGFDLDERRTLQALGVGTSDVSLQDQIDALTAVNTAQGTSITNLNAWAAALATKLNAQFTVANAEDTLPFSPALAVDYDTNPQA